MAIFSGNNNANLIKGSNSSDVINGYGGNDELWGMDGNDWIYGGDGNDMIRGGEGNDRLYGHDGSDLVYGDDGDDQIEGGDGNDGLFGGNGNDQVWGGEGNDHITGVAGNDQLWGEAGNDHLEGGDGDDKLYGGDGDDILEGGYGDDRLEGSAGNDTLYAGGGSNVLVGGTGNDTLSTQGMGAWLSETKMYGGIGNDLYSIFRVSSSVVMDDVVPDVIEYENEGTDTIHLGSSFFNEMTTYNMPAFVENLTAFRSPAAALWSTPDENVRIVGNALNNVIIGTPEDDYLEGGAGNDTLMSRRPEDASLARQDKGFGEDVMDGGKGNDRLVEIGQDMPVMYGGEGNDTYVLADNGYAGTDLPSFHGWSAREAANGGYDVVYSASASTFLPANVEDLTYTGNAAQTHLWGNELANFITGGKDSADDIRGGAGNDILDGGVGAGADTVDGGAGNDLLRGWGGADTLVGGSGNDIMFGGDDGDLLYGGADNDELQGDAGNDLLSGEAGADMLFGGAGDDHLYGGSGIDKMSGGTGKDIFHVLAVTDSQRSTGLDTITDFMSGQDKIDLSSIDANTALAGNQGFKFIGTQAPVMGAAGGQLWVQYDQGNTWVKGDIGGDGVADFELMLSGVVQLTAQDFML